ncbi:unnamed protein product [Toxocara canis]|uniref:CRAL-TRIO domain-containing protein n=1 Tax=Toxocara canis TaxID=6265 RepID=A0A183UZR2_TOXCA|nr:unnamed protein product [Toxocara canis]
MLLIAGPGNPGERSSILYVLDLNGLKYDKRLLSLVTGALAGISSFMSDNYVEMIHSFVVVNAPSFISTIWSIARPLLPERTRNKVQIFGSGWRNDMLTLAVPDVLPSYWNDDEIDVFKANVERAVTLNPAGYYKADFSKDAQLLTVAAGKADFISVSAQKEQLLKWSILSNGYFAYSVYFTDDTNNNDIKSMKSIYPLFTKIPGPMLVPMGEEIRCEESGVYKFWFSNEHAWIQTLRIRYQIAVE